MLISVGMNRKLSKEIGLFNLPARKTCPGRTKLCDKICYAMKAERCYKSARERRRLNYIASKKDTFIGDILAELDSRKIKMVRIHESGDFYSQEYLDKWIEIIKMRPNTKFLAYTKMFGRLDFNGIPNNLVLYYSMDKTSTTIPPEDGNPRCMIVDDKSETPKRWYHCAPVNKEHHNYCGKSCKVCWNSKSNVTWLAH